MDVLKKAIIATMCLTAILVISFCTCVHAQVTTKAITYNEYKAVFADLRFILPNDWTYLADYSNDSFAAFRGSDMYDALIIQVVNVPNQYKEDLSLLADLFKNTYSYGNPLVSLLAEPKVYDLGGTDALVMIYISVENEVPLAKIEVMAVSNGELISVVIQDSEQGFMNNFEMYEIIVQSLTFNQDISGLLRNMIIFK